MDTNKIKRLATGAREELRALVSARLDAVLAEDSTERLSQSRLVKGIEDAIRRDGREEVVDSAAYTWFNRLCALRYMDARGYTPTSVVTPREGSTQPAILADVAHGIFDPDYGFSQKVRTHVTGLLSGAIRSDNATEEAYDELLIGVCAHYAEPMGYLFSEDAASSLLMPPGLLSEDSILRRIVEDMDDDECESVEVLGWLYQFYIAERRDEYFKSNRKATREDIAPATQLFTPEWIVRYLSENSLGRLWVLNNPSSNLPERMDYFVPVDEGADEPYLKVSSAEEIRVLDPACGSGHILVYCFDLLYDMYEEEGWPPEDIPQKILEKNLFGLEIDQRAAEIASFALEMKARERDQKFFEKQVDAHITVLKSAELSSDERVLVPSLLERTELLNAMGHMDEIGSLYVPDNDAAPTLEAAIAELKNEGDLFASSALDKCRTMLENINALSGTYQCVVANPPYMGSGNMGPFLSGWVKEHYPNEKGDLCTCFINRGLKFTTKDGYSSIITSDTCMYISSFEKMRKNIINNSKILTLIDTRGSNAHPDMFDANTGWVLKKTCSNNDLSGAYFKLNQPISKKDEALRQAIRNPECGWFYRADAEKFKLIPGLPIAYWVSENLINAFSQGLHLGDIAQPRKGLGTGNNILFTRMWWEVSYVRIKFSAQSNEEALASRCRWFPLNKGGSFRKWYGNNDYIVDWSNDGSAIKSYKNQSGKLGARPQNQNYYFKECVTWSKISSGQLAFRYKPAGSIFNEVAPAYFTDRKTMFRLEAFLNSSVCCKVAEAISPTLDFQVGQVATYPVLPGVLQEATEEKVAKATAIAKDDWDAFEISWDFESHPLCQGNNLLLRQRFLHWSEECQNRFDTLKSIEEDLNRIIVRIYHMENEAPIEIPDNKVSVRLADCERDVKSLVSYAVGCMFGRYSLDTDGLVLANQGDTIEDYLQKVPAPTFKPDEDNVIPILDGDWFEDDIVTRFYQFLAAAYGEETLDENVAFIEEALGKNIRTYFVKDFYKDHWHMYQKRPIYWLFQSPNKSFGCLIYMHRYTESTVGEILAKYIRPFEEKLRGRIRVLENSGNHRDIREADKLKAKVQDVESWERDVIYPLAHERVSIDLDDGVKINYNKFPHALAKIPKLSEWK